MTKTIYKFTTSRKDKQNIYLSIFSKYNFGVYFKFSLQYFLGFFRLSYFLLQF